MLITSTDDICIQHLGRVEEVVFTARRSYASAVFGVIILSICPSVTRVLCDESKEPTGGILYHMKGQSF